MKRDKFAAGETAAKWDDESSGLVLYPYRDSVVKEKTIWRSINPLFYQGMLMVRKQLSGHYEADPEDKRFDAWDVIWRSDNGKEDIGLVLQTSDIIESFEPVFQIVK